MERDRLRSWAAELGQRAATAEAGDLDYDLAVSTSVERPPSPVDVGIRLPQEAIAIPGSGDWTLPGLVVAVLLTFGFLAVVSRPWPSSCRPPPARPATTGKGRSGVRGR